MSSNENESSNVEDANDHTGTETISTSTLDFNRKNSMVNMCKNMPSPNSTCVKKKVSQTFIVKKIGKDCKTAKPENLTYKIRAVIKENNVRKVFPRIYIGAPMLTNPSDLIDTPSYNTSSVLSDLFSKTLDNAVKTSIDNTNVVAKIVKPRADKSKVTPSVGKKTVSTIFPTGSNANGIYSVKSPLTTFKITARTVASAVVPNSVCSNSNPSQSSRNEKVKSAKVGNSTDAERDKKVVDRLPDDSSMPKTKTAVSSKVVQAPITLKSTLANSKNCLPLMKVKVVSGKVLSCPKDTTPESKETPEPREELQSLQTLETCSKNLVNGAFVGEKRKLDSEDLDHQPPAKTLRLGAEIQFEDGIKHFVTDLKELTYLNDDPIKSWEDIKKGNKVAAMWKDGLFYDAKVVCCYRPTQERSQPILKLGEVNNTTIVEETVQKQDAKQQKKSECSKVMCSACKIVFNKIKDFRRHQRDVCKSPGVTVLSDSNVSDAKDCTKFERVSLIPKKRDKTDTFVTKKVKSIKNQTYEKDFKPPKAADGKLLFRTGTKFLHRWQLEDGSSRWYQGEIKRIVSNVHDRSCDFEVMYKGEEDQEPYLVKLYEDYPTDIRFMGRL